MKTSNLMKIVVLALMMFAFNQSINAQFFKKLGKAVDKATTAVDKTTTALAADANSESEKLNWEKIPVYTAQKVTVVDADGNPVLLEDGTPDIRVFLVDQFGNKRDSTVIKAQFNEINRRLVAILAKVGGGAAVGGLAKGFKGALAGATTGALTASSDIEMALKQKKSLVQQNKLLDVYTKNFTVEGKPINAKVDPAKLKGLELDEEKTSSVTKEKLKEELDKESYSSVDESNWNF